MTDEDVTSTSVVASDTKVEIPDPEQRQLVPVWLAALVLALLLSVMVMIGYIARGVIGDDGVTTPEELEVARREAAAEADPDDPQARLALGFAYQQAGLYREALAEYDRVLKEWPNDTAALYNKGIVLLETDEGEKAELVLRDVLEVDPYHVLAAKALGEYYVDKGGYRSVISVVGPVVDEQESAADLQYLMGLAHENLGESEEAQARYRLALKYYPDMPEAREGLERLGVAP